MQEIHSKRFATGLILAIVGSIAFSGKAIIVKLAYRYGVDAVTLTLTLTLIMYRMLFALPIFAGTVLVLGAFIWCRATDPLPLSEW